jgi:hypothetical protein
MRKEIFTELKCFPKYSEREKRSLAVPTPAEGCK